MIFDAKEYKLAKIIEGDLQTVLKLMEGLEYTMFQLQTYRRYKYVNKMIETYLESRSVIETQHKKYKLIKEKKGAK